MFKNWKEEIRLFLFTDNMIFHVENFKESIKTKQTNKQNTLDTSETV